MNGARLRIGNLALEDSGMYQCVAENKHGTVYSTAELRVQGRRGPSGTIQYCPQEGSGRSTGPEFSVAC